MAAQPRRICMVSRIQGVAGPAGFQRRFATVLATRGIEVSYSLADEPYAAVLVIGGTRQLWGLWKAKRRGIPIYQRLNGMNWIHRVRRTGLRHFLRAEINNFLLRVIRNRLADGIIYQSEFSLQWWQREFGPAPVAEQVVHNAVPLEAYHPGAAERPQEVCRILIVEGNLGGGYEFGLGAAVGMSEFLQEKYDLQVEVLIAGNAEQSLQQAWDARTDVLLQWLGLVPWEAIPQLDRSAHMLYVADIHPACPNSVIEALACGLPVVAHDTGALSELVDENSGRIVSYGADPWKLEQPDIVALADAAFEIYSNQGKFRASARKRAERMFDVNMMTDGYLAAMDWGA